MERTKLGNVEYDRIIVARDRKYVASEGEVIPICLECGQEKEPISYESFATEAGLEVPAGMDVRDVEVDVEEPKEPEQASADKDHQAPAGSETSV